ncbi:hypothetical protein [Ilumatobacter coccineus]|uniref:Uncharacterized protein n=1 Tax=Ilumatobacter coccineus (strain NBRC 103263 / KCTC 29153 / YM16-304) TaxID=1313172 RepID=A0A6C7E1L2_ILUCY|nr:hypothetical protein [Ilumatobacter coccineus]BAN00773.1 hypothetical protein YM304_04590 [Ilumatobacter coccineus YM16-304]
MSNEPEAHTTPDAADNVRAAVFGAAENVDIGSLSDPLGEVRATVHRRRRRRNALVGTAAAATLVVGGVVVANVVSDDGNGDERIVSAPATDPVVTTGEADDAPAVTAPVDSTAPVTAPVVEVGSAGTAIAETIAPAESFVAGSYQQMVPWKDGFLVIGQTQAEQALPTELPDEINEAFPPEVVQFFEDAGGLPPTINEAIAMLQEAGLYDVVSDVVLNNPEVSEAIYSVPMAPPEPFARVSDDGITWTDIALDISFDEYGDRRVFSTGDRLAVVSLEYEPFDPTTTSTPLQHAPRAAAIVVQTTTDLETWSVQRTEIATNDAELPDYIYENTYLSSVGVNDDRWVATIESYQEADYDALLPDDFDRSFMDSQYGWGIYHDADGLVIDVYDETGGSEQRRFSWSELGFTEVPPGIDTHFDGGNQRATSWSAPWGGDATATPISGLVYGSITGFDGGFIRQGEVLRHSTDGVTWTEIDRPDAFGWISTVISVPDGLIGFFQQEDGSTDVHRLDLTTLTWSPVDEPSVPDGFSPWSDGSAGGVLYSIENYQYDDVVEPIEMEPFEVSVRNDDYVLDGMFDSLTQSYTVTDILTGDVVVSETVDAGPSEFEYLVEVGDTVEIVSPETGDVLTVFTAERLETMETSADDVSPPTVVTYEEMPADMEYVQPELNVLATNGEEWINQRLDLGTPEPNDAGWSDVLYPNEVVVNNDIVLISMSDGSFVRLTF